MMISKQVVSICSNLEPSPDFWSSLLGDSVIAEIFTTGQFIYIWKNKCFYFVFLLHLFYVYYIFVS